MATGAAPDAQGLGGPIVCPCVQRSGAGLGTIAPHALHEMNDYAQWAKGNPDYPYQPVQDIDELRATGMYLVLTPDECVEFATANGGLFVKPLMGGLSPDLAWESLESWNQRCCHGWAPGSATLRPEPHAKFAADRAGSRGVT